MANIVDPVVYGRAGSVHRPETWYEALDIRAANPQADPICGGTDLMVAINFDRTRPDGLLDLSAIPELSTWELIENGSVVRIGAGMTYTRIIAELATYCPALAIAARTVGSPQIRNRGTIGGNLATASPAGDCHPPLLATRASVEVASIRGTRLIGIDDFFVGPKQSALVPEELIRAVHVPVARGPQHFAKIGPRNAMVIATASFALSVDPIAQRVGTGIGSAGPTPLRAAAAEQLLEQSLQDSWRESAEPDADAVREFGQQVAQAALPIDDVRGSASYRRHALGVLARRCATWACAELAERASR